MALYLVRICTCEAYEMQEEGMLIYLQKDLLVSSSSLNWFLMLACASTPDFGSRTCLILCRSSQWLQYNGGCLADEFLGQRVLLLVGQGMGQLRQVQGCCHIRAESTWRP